MPVKIIMMDALEDRNGTISIEARTITKLRFADDIDGLARNEQEFANLVKSLDEPSSRYGISMEISAEKTKIMTNSARPITTKITVSGKELETVDHFKYL